MPAPVSAASGEPGMMVGEADFAGVAAMAPGGLVLAVAVLAAAGGAVPARADTSRKRTVVRSGKRMQPACEAFSVQVNRVVDDRQIRVVQYSGAMRAILMILLGLDMLAVVGVMLAGVLGMASPGRDPRTSNRLMRWRVTLQAVAIALVVALMLT